jgi:hypothetical protein
MKVGGKNDLEAVMPATFKACRVIKIDLGAKQQHLNPARLARPQRPRIGPHSIRAASCGLDLWIDTVALIIIKLRG